MIRKRIGVVLDSLKQRTKEGLRTSALLGFTGVQISATQQETSPENLSQTGRRELRHLINTHRLRLCALGGELGTGFVNQNEFNLSIKKIKEIINLALDLQTEIITIQIGDIPPDVDTSHGSMVRLAVNEIGRHAENYGCTLAARIRFGCTSTLNKFLLSLQTGGVKLVWDPAFLISNNIDPVKSIYELHEHIIHTNLWDTRQTEEGRKREIPVGEGAVPYEEFIATLEAVGYKGFYMINSQELEHPVEGIRKGKEFLEKL